MQALSVFQLLTQDILKGKSPSKTINIPKIDNVDVCAVSRVMSFSSEASDITLCQLHISRECMKANEIVQFTEKRC